MTPEVPLEERFWRYVRKGPACWQWTGPRNKSNPAKAYGRIVFHGVARPAHRIGYELLVGPIPEEMTVDHLCRNKLCVNPDHLEIVSRGENARRHMSSIPACVNGHAFDEANTRHHKGKRFCRQCSRDNWHRHYAKRRSEAALSPTTQEKPK